MKTVLLIILALFCIVLLVGCGQRDIIKPTIETPGVNSSNTADNNKDSTDITKDDATTSDDNLEKTDITQDDLDQLKKDIDGMEFDDISTFEDKGSK